jgi:hypothetical protein
MKIRIVEDLEGCGDKPWFRLERWTPSAIQYKSASSPTSFWEIIDSGPSLGVLEFKADIILVRWSLLKGPQIREIVLKEFDSDPQSLVDDPPPTA